MAEAVQGRAFFPVMLRITLPHVAFPWWLAAEEQFNSLNLTVWDGLLISLLQQNPKRARLGLG
jgi:hypothetical protein